MSQRASNQRPSVFKNDVLWCSLCSIVGLIVLILMNAWAFRHIILFAAIVAPWVKRVLKYSIPALGVGLLSAGTSIGVMLGGVSDQNLVSEFDRLSDAEIQQIRTRLAL